MLIQSALLGPKAALSAAGLRERKVAHRREQGWDRLHAGRLSRTRSAVDGRCRGRELIAISVLSSSVSCWRGHQCLLSIPGRRVRTQRLPTPATWRATEYRIHSATSVMDWWRIRLHRDDDLPSFTGDLLPHRQSTISSICAKESNNGKSCAPVCQCHLSRTPGAHMSMTALSMTVSFEIH